MLIYDQESTDDSRSGTASPTHENAPDEMEIEQEEADIGGYSADTGSMKEAPAWGQLTLAFRGAADR